ALILTERAQKIQVEKGGAREISWPCQAVQSGQAQLQFTVQGSNAQDSVKLTFPVNEIEKKQTLALYGATEDATEQLVEMPQSINEQIPSEFNLSFASTALINLRGSMLYLLTYPYDCLEQKMSKILPVIEGAKLVSDFNLGDTKEYKQQVQKILQLMTSYQTSSGGFAYWPDEIKADPYVTAYALETAYRAKQAGYQVPSAALEKAEAWLKGIFGDSLQMAYPYSTSEIKTTQAYAVYVLALYGQRLDGQFNNLYSQRNALTPAAQSYLLLAAESLRKGEEIKKNLAQGLLNQAVYGAQTMHFTTGEPQEWLHVEDIKTTALALEALLRSNANFAQPYQAVRWLTQQLTPQGHWASTSANAAVFSALNAYYKQREAVVPDFAAMMELNGRNEFMARFEGRSNKTQSKQWPLRDIYLKGSPARLQIFKSGAGTLYYTLAQIYAPQTYKDALNAGFVVSRQITDLAGNPVTELRALERYKVTLKTVTSAPYSFVVLEDFIPAGFELVNTSLVTESRADAASLDNSGWGGFERDEKYDDRIAIFADYLTAGEHEYSYLVQASIVGNFSYPSAWGSQLYDPAVFGRTATSSVKIKPE
ncbi:MAG: hypothetical protein J6U96_00105, partial [Elusimicrobiaceae bacterium]|nr:hypothetical protein [Elusimicrobiaceae bacterium]